MKRKLYLSLLFAGVISIAGCGGASFLPNPQTSTIATVSVTCSPSSVSASGTTQCQAVVTGSGAYSSGVAWTANSGTISSSGLYTAPAVYPASGSATVTVTATSTQDKSKFGQGVLNFGNASPISSINGVSVVAKPSSLTMGQTANCSATVSGSGSYSTAVSWTATGGTITQSGVFSPTAPGSGTCTAYSTQDDTKSGTATISTAAAPAAPIATAVTGISVTATPSSINTGQTATCSANVNGTGSYSNAVVWTATGGTISQSGVFTPSGVGTGTCTATSTQAGFTNIAGSASINVTNVAPTVTGVTVVANPSSITSDKTSTCVATVNGTGAFATGVTWTATGGTITPAGVFTPSGTGTGTCKATSTQAGYTNVSGSAAINVTAPAPTVTSIAVVANPSAINSSQTATCSATVNGTGAFSTGVTWTATGGTITPAGVFTPSGTGTGTCTATSTQAGYTNISSSAAINVTNVTPTITGITVAASPSSINSSQTSTCVATVSGTGAYSNSVTWTATGGTITPAGVFTPSGTGTGTCKATSTQSGYTTVAGQASINVTAATPTVTGITVVANPSSITTSQTSTCSATVNGTGSFATGVTWTATGGTITPAGVFTPSGTGTGSCIAASTQSGYTNVTGQAAINVTSSSGTATLSVNATTIAFGTVALNTSVTQSVTLTATGTTAVTISAASVTGTGFSMTGGTSSITLNPNQSTTLYVVFDPTVSGPATGQLKISSNASSGATTLVSLTGTGQASYQVNLTWNAPASSTDPVAGYNVFRAPTGTTAYVQLTTSAVTATNYVDGSPQNGTTYDYMVQSVDASGVSSGPSNTYTAAIPQY
jgi:hypothetical protein